MSLSYGERGPSLIGIRLSSGPGLIPPVHQFGQQGIVNFTHHNAHGRLPSEFYVYGPTFCTNKITQHLEGRPG